MSVTACGKSVRLLSSCPADTEQLLFFNVDGEETGMGLRTWGKVKECLFSQIFGTGILTFTGADLDGDGVYFVSGLIDRVFVYAMNLPNFLEATSQWDFERNDDNEIIGIKILIGYESEDRFIVFPAPQP